jgi:hypothetical protein
MRHGRFFGFCIMILAGIFILIDLYSYSWCRATQLWSQVARRAITCWSPDRNQPQPPESKERSNPTALILSGILFVIGAGMYYSELRRIRPLFVNSPPEPRTDSERS